MRKLLSLALALFVVAACDRAPTQTDTVTPPELDQAVTVNDRTTVPLFIRAGCGGEAIDGESTSHVVVSSTQTPSGRIHLTIHWNIKGQGTGLDTGAKYQLNETRNFSQNADVGDMPLVITVTERIRVIGQGQVPNRHVDFVGHATINANGDIVRNEGHFEDTCS